MITPNVNNYKRIKTEQNMYYFYSVSSDGKDKTVFNLIKKNKNDDLIVIDISSCNGNFDNKLTSSQELSKYDKMDSKITELNGKKIITIQNTENYDYYLSVWGIDEGNFLEWANFVGHRYGTPKSIVEDLRNQGKNVLLEIEINGAEQVLSKVKDDRVVSFYLKPPSMKQLEERIRKRKSETEEVIQKRLAKAEAEMEKAKNYDFVVMNDRINRAGDEIIKILKEFDKD